MAPVTSTSSWVSPVVMTSEASVPVTRNRGPGACWSQLPHRWETAPLLWRSATKTSSSSPVSRVRSSAWTWSTRAEELEGLVDEVGAEVEQGASARAGAGPSGGVPLEP